MPEGMNDHRYVGWDSFVNLRRRAAVFIDKVKQLFLIIKPRQRKLIEHYFLFYFVLDAPGHE